MTVHPAGAARASPPRAAAARAARPFDAALRAAFPRARALAARAVAPEEARCALAQVTPREVAALRAIVRALPVTIAALGPRAAAGLSLDLGRALAVELRPAPAGLELVLRPEPHLARVTAAELPALVKALRDRGVRVARAGVRAR